MQALDERQFHSLNCGIRTLGDDLRGNEAQPVIQKLDLETAAARYYSLQVLIDGGILTNHADLTQANASGDNDVSSRNDVCGTCLHGFRRD